MPASFPVASERSVAAPSFTTWTRLEPHSRDATLARSLQAQVRDPLWMLSRQWQVGEYAGEDAGSPVQVTLGLESRALTGYRPGPSGPVAPFDEATALETHVERNAVHFQVRGSVQLGLLFTDLAEDAGLPKATVTAFAAAFPIATVDPNPALAGLDGLQLRALAAGRSIDGESLFRSVQAARSGLSPVPPLPAEAADPATSAVLDQFVALRAGAFDEPTVGAGAWQPAELSYEFGLEAASTDGNSKLLETDRFGGGHLDWYSFDTVPGRTASNPVEPLFSTTNMLPQHVTFHGMPSDRWWGFEDGKTDFGQLDVEHVDLAKLLVMEFALVYGSDWFYVPVPATFGSLLDVTALVVTDTFGERTVVRRAQQYPVQGSNRPWTMFTLSDGAGGTGSGLLLAPTLGQTEDADPIEDILITRDTTAALAWAVEQTVQGASDTGVDAYEAYLSRLRQSGQVPPPDPAPEMPSVAYTLERPAPDNWIPLIPVLPAPGAAALFRRGTMDIPGPGGTVLKLAAHAELLHPNEPFYLTDRVVTPIGVSAQRLLRRTRLPDGTTVVWHAYRSGPGRGLRASGLRFDYLRDDSDATKS